MMRDTLYALDGLTVHKGLRHSMKIRPIVHAIFIYNYAISPA